ncbi:UDP-N-acetylmuramoyl-tripeptide--D-alanyl-D-alanine ligase [Porphyromonadaceae bacterium COT-184 OH4590]|nr:UDP-N-acetylmuramoyl-tripeptide--D-alanyl-D-alanine ligase [Porphyromonadaceae bacterium COT-184 OH4590]
MGEIQQLYEVFKQYPKITIDSRCCPPNSIFFALRGENVDGNDYAEKALNNGAEYAVVDRVDVAQNDRYIVVDDVLTAMQRLAAHHRSQMKTKIIAITGTNGKTTTKELVATVLAKKYNVLYTDKNHNNHIGVPLTLLRLTEDDEFGVIEIGANHKGEIAELCKMVQPDYGLITNFGRAHLEGFGSLEGVIEAKTELFEYLKENRGRVFININNNNIVEHSKGIGNISYAINNDKADVSGYITEQNPCVTFSWSSPRFFVVTQKVQTNLVGTYNADNLLAAIVMGLFFEIEPESINEAIKEYIPENHRSQYLKTDNNDLVIDAYNANPSSMEAALRNFANLKYPHKTVILGDMLEMGAFSDDDHRETVDLISALKFDKVFLIGDNFSKIESSYVTFRNVEEFITYIKDNPLINTAILLKGSNGIGLEQAIEYLK